MRVEQAKYERDQRRKEFEEGLKNPQTRRNVLVGTVAGASLGTSLALATYYFSFGFSNEYVDALVKTYCFLRLMELGRDVAFDYDKRLQEKALEPAKGSPEYMKKHFDFPENTTPPGLSIKPDPKIR